LHSLIKNNVAYIIEKPYFNSFYVV